MASGLLALQCMTVSSEQRPYPACAPTLSSQQCGNAHSICFLTHSIVDQEATREAGAGAGIAEAEPVAGAVPMEVFIATGELVVSPC